MKIRITLTALFTLFTLTLFLFTRAHAQDDLPDKDKAYNLHYPEIRYTQLRKAIDAGQIFIIDASSTQSYTAGHVPQARSINNPESLALQLPILKNYPIAVYCGGPQCNAWHKAADFAAARGYTNVMHYKGGIKGWKEAGDTLTSGNEFK